MTLATLRSRHTVEIYDIRLEPTGVYLVMQHIEGQTIADVARTGSMPEARAESILIQVLDGLASLVINNRPSLSSSRRPTV